LIILIINFYLDCFHKMVSHVANMTTRCLFGN
jgi:hypothetical protein